jgi:AcrR family transcriptional regulator
MTIGRAGTPPAPNVKGRPRDSAASKQALLDAAQELFGLSGYEGTTTRDIGERAGVDPALIARYFGSKADLYIAALVAESQGDQPQSDFNGFEETVKGLVTRVDEHGLGPVTQALIRSDTSDQIRQAAQAHMTRRLVVPIVADMANRGIDDPQLCSEVVVSALLGITLGRCLGWFPQLQTVPRDRLLALITELLG